MKSSLSGEGEVNKEDGDGDVRSCYSSSSSKSTFGIVNYAACTRRVTPHPKPVKAEPLSISVSPFVVAFRDLPSKILFYLLLFYTCCNGLVAGAMSCNISTGELNALEALYDATDGDNWDWRTADDDITSYYYEPYNGGSIWAFPASLSDPCSNEWQGIICSPSLLLNGSCYVESLILKYYNLQGGPLPKEISGLTRLLILDLRHNGITGAIPTEIGELTNLQNLNLNSSFLNGQIPSQLTNLHALRNLTLSYNGLTGPIPSPLSTKLLNLDVRSNHLNGTIPSALYSMTDLQLFRLSSNSFSGSISSSISNMKSLLKISFGTNRFTGSIPSEIASLTKLLFLFFNQNQMTGTIPNQLSELTRLIRLDLIVNKLNGTIPSQLSALTGLTNMGLDTNQLTGTIPSQLSTLKRLTILDLFTNRLTGTIPSQVSGLTGLIYLRIYENKLNGTIPSQLSELTELISLDLSENQLKGAIPSQLSGLTKMFDLELRGNQLEGTIPAQLSRLVNIQYLYLNGNKLSGAIPSWLSTLTDLIFLYLGDNEFNKDAFPDIFSSLNNLTVISLTGISLTGTLPVSLRKLSSSLVLFDVSNNALSGGDPFFFIGFPKIQLVNISYNRYDYDISSLKLSTVTPSLQYLDVSSNKLGGSFPHDVGTLFPSLVLLSASNNCLWSYIPSSLCKSSNLTTLLLNKLGSECSYSNISEILFSDNRYYTIPSCLLQLPNLKTAHFVSNALYGSLGEIGYKMTSLSLVGNLLWGTIPTSVQTSSSLDSLELSINRFSGTLRDDAFTNMPSYSTINLYSNRLSGNISKVKSLGKFSQEVDILSGNLFGCDKPPSNDLRHDTYSCGTSSFDYYKYVYAGVGAMILCALCMYLWSRFLSNTNGINKRHVFVEYFKVRAFPSDMYLSVVRPQFLFACLSVALLMTFINLGLNSSHKYSEFDSSYSIIAFTYGWTSTFVYVHGVGSYLLVILGLSLLLFVYVKYFDQSNNNNGGGLSKSNGDARGGGDSMASLSSEELSSTSSSFPSDANSSIMLRCLAKFEYLCKHLLNFMFSLVSSKDNLVLLALQLLNILVVAAVNVAYIFVENNSRREKKIDSGYKVLVPIALGAFKTLWASTYVYYMAQYGVRSKLSAQNVFYNYYFAMVFIFVLVPIFTVYFTDVDCFYYPSGFGNIEGITEQVTTVIPAVSCTDFTCSDIRISFVNSDISTSQVITPAWIYGYQCGLTILKNYIPALLSTYTIRGIVMPVLRLFLLSLSPSSPLRNSWIIKYLLPYTANATDEKDIVKDEHRELRTLDYLINHQIDLLMLFTFGIICPFMSILILFAMIATEVVDHMQIGSYLCDKAREVDEDFNDEAIKKDDKVASNTELTNEGAEDIASDSTSSSFSPPTTTLTTTTTTATTTTPISTKAFSLNKGDTMLVQFNLVSKIYLNNSRDLVLSIWKPNLLVILFFMQLILFDMIADIYSIEYGLVSVSVYTVWIWFLFSDRMERVSYSISSLYSIYTKLLAYFKKTMREGGVSDSSIRRSNDSTQDQVELGDVNNPIQSQSSL